METLEVEFNELLKKSSENVELSEFSTNIAVFLETIVNERVKYKEEEFKQLQEKVETFKQRGMSIQKELADIKELVLSFRERLIKRSAQVNDNMLSNFEIHFKVYINKEGE